VELSLTVVILTKNEEIHLARCIGSLRGLARKILVIDSFSTDRTVEIAKSLGADVRQNPFKNYSTQFLWGLSQIEQPTDWVLRIDADEWLDDDLRNAIRTTIPTLDKTVTGLRVLLRNHFMGRPIRFGARGNMYLLRLWRPEAGTMEARWMDEHITLSHGETRDLAGLLLHSTEKPLSEWIVKHDRYSDREAIDVLTSKYNLFSDKSGESVTYSGVEKSFGQKIYYGIGGSVAPFLFFIYRYIFRGGFLDGSGGYYYNFFQGYWYRTLVAAKLYELESKLKDCTTNEERRAVIRAHTGQDV